MRKKLNERLKDIIIDEIYHYCYNEVVTKIEFGSLKVTLDAGMKLDDNPDIKDLIHLYAEPSGGGKMFYDTRNVPFCSLIKGKITLKSFMNILKSQGYRQNDTLHIGSNPPAIEVLCSGIDFRFFKIKHFFSLS